LKEFTPYLFLLLYTAAVKGSLPVWENSGSKGVEEKSSKCQGHETPFDYKDKQYSGEVNMLGKKHQQSLQVRH
jgi:hypothetical protein